MFPLPITGPVLSSLETPSDIEKKEKPLSEDEMLANKVDLDIAEALKEHEDVSKQVDADIALIEKPIEKDAFGEVKDPITKGIESVQSGISSIIGDDKQESPFVNELSERIRTAGPNKIDQYDKDIISTLNGEEQKDLLERHPWVYPTLTKDQKDEQFKLSRESNISALGATARAVGQVGNFGLDLVKAGWNLGLDSAYAEFAAPIKDAWTGETKIDPVSLKPISPRQQLAREKVNADLRNAAGAFMNTVIETQRQIEKYTGGTGTAFSGIVPTNASVLSQSIGGSPLFLATKLAEAGKNPDSGYAAFIDGLNEQFGFQDTSMSQKHYENRKLYEAEKSAEDWNAGQGSELVSPWSKAVYNPAFQFLNLQRESWMLPNVKTYAKLKGISEDQAEIELSQQAEANAETNLRDATLKWNKEYDPSMELLGGMFMGDAALDVAGIGVGGARLIGKGFKRFETAGMSPEAINALMTARQARQREILAENIANAQKRSIAGKVAKGTEEIQGKIYEKGSEFLAPIKATYEKIPAPLRGLAQIGGLGTAGAYAGYILNPEDQEKGILKGLGTVAGAATVLGAVPGVVRSIDEARMLRAGGSQLGEGLLETAGKLPTSTTTTKILFGGKRGPVADYLADNFHTLGKAGINFAALNAINSSINSDSPEKFIDSIAEGFVMGAGFKLFGKIHGSDPESELDARKRKDIEIYLSRQRQSDQTRENMDSLRNYQNYVDASQDNIVKMQVELEKAQQSNDPEKITKAQKAIDVAQEIHNQILSANVQTRNEMGRMMDEIYSDGNSLLNGARKVGQQNVQLEVLTTPQIVDLLSKQYPNKTADELTFMANQRGFFMPQNSTSIVNFDKIVKRQYLFGESLTEAFRHELGHAAWSIKEFRDLNKTADELLFDQVQRNLNGEILDIKPGKFSEDDLFELYSSKYLKNKTQEEIDQYAKESGLWDYNTNSLNRPSVIDYMKDEVRAELVSGNLSQGYGKMKSQSRSIDDWVSLRNKTNLLARAMQNALGIGAKPFQSKLLGVKYDPEIVAANRKAIESLRKYNGEFEDAPESKKGQDIPEKVMRNDPVMRKRYGLNGGEYQTTFYAEVRDADGKVVGKRVPVTSENAKEGTWSNDATTGETKRTRGYGNVPEEFAQVEIPSGGSLNILTDFAVESDGKTPIRRSDKDIEELNENRRVAIKEAIDLASDRYTDPRWMKAYSEDGESYDGLFSPEQIRNIKNLPESVLPLSIKEKIIALNNIMLMNDGSTVEFDYAPRLKGKKYKGRRSEIYSLILGGKFHLSKATNFGVNAVSRGAWKRKLNARKDRMPNWFSPWGNDTGLFEKEMQEVYLQNTYDKKPGWYGLDPENPTEKTPLAEEKWNKFKDFLNMVSKDMPTPENPWRMKTPSAKGKEGKAQGDIDNLWRQFRLDAIADWADSTDATGRYKMGWENIYKQLLPIDESGEPIDFKTPDQQKRKGISTNFMPEAPIEAETERYPTSERGMYSGLQKTIDEKVQGKFASPDQLKAIVTNPQNAKAEELKWSGVLGEIDRLAAENQGKVPKDKVMDYLRNEGAVKFDEVTLGSVGGLSRFPEYRNAIAKSEKAQNRIEELDREYQELASSDEGIKKWEEINSKEWDNVLKEKEDADAIVEKYVQSDLNTELQDSKFAQYQLPGGKNYREVVMTMPVKFNESEVSYSKTDDGYQARIPNLSNYGYGETKEDALKMLKARIASGEYKGDQYTSSHFPDTPNYVAHMRLNERTDAQGNEGLFVEELQSDRHQAGREKGYREDFKPLSEEEKKRLDIIRDKVEEMEMQGAEENPTPEYKALYSETLNLMQRNQGGSIDSPTDAPFRKDWSLQLFKRALRDAVDSDKKWIGWTTGIEQVKRYEEAMRQAVDEITWNTPKGYQKAFAAIKNGNTVLAGKINDDGSVYDSDTADANGKQLSEVLGKEVASKILAENSGTATGNDLTVGGEGMKGFYDQILPKEIGKYVAKMGGKVEKSEIATPKPDKKIDDLTDAELLQELARKGDTTPIWRVDITPEMKRAVQGGQLQFMPAEQPAEYESISARIRPLEGISAPTKVVGAKALSLGEIEPPVRGKAMLPDMELKPDISEKGIQTSDKTGLQFMPAEGERPTKNMPQSALNVLYADSKDLPKPDKKITNAKVALALADIAERTFGGKITSSTITPEIIEDFALNGANEAEAALKSSGKNAANWYSTAIKAALAVAGTIHRALSDIKVAKQNQFFAKEYDPVRAAQFALRLPLAITSQNVNVPLNTEYAELQFNHFQETGKFDIKQKHGSKAPAISSNLNLANVMIDKLGSILALEDFVKKEFTVRDLEIAASKIAGKKITISGLKDDIVNGAAIFGPKIGQGFLQNLMGKFDPVTIDLWMRRTWGRWTGDVVGDGVTGQRLARIIEEYKSSKRVLPDFLKGIKTEMRSLGTKSNGDPTKPELTISEDIESKIENDSDFRKGIEQFSKEANAEFQIYYKLMGEPMTKKSIDNLVGSIQKANETQDTDESKKILSTAYNKLISDQSKIKSQLDSEWSQLTPAQKKELNKQDPTKAISKEKWKADQHILAKRTETLQNEQKNIIKPKWANAAKSIIADLNPIDIPSDIDRKVITIVVNKIRQHLEERGYDVTNADVQAILWYPEKDLWAKLRGEEESNLKQSYDDEFLKIAEERGVGKEARKVAKEIRGY